MAGRLHWILFFILNCLATQLIAKPEVSSFNVALRIQKDASVSIRETFLVKQGEGEEFKFPFVRRLPKFFVMEDGFPQDVKYKVLVSTNGVQKLPFTVKLEDEFYSISVGDPKKSVKTKEFRIIIEYMAEDVIQYFKGYDMLRWQGLYNYSDIPIKRTKIRMYTPEKGKILSHESTIKIRGKESILTFFRKISNGGAYIFDNTQLNNTDGIHFMISWPKGLVTPPSFYKKTYRIILRYPMYVLYFLLLSFYLWSFIYIFYFQSEKNPIRFLSNMSPGTLYAICKKKFDYKAVFYSIVRLTGNGNLHLDYGEGRFFIILRNSSGLKYLDKKIYDSIKQQSKNDRIEVSKLSFNEKDWLSFAISSAEEIKLPKADKQRKFFYFIFLSSAIILTYTFSRYDFIFCMATLYLLVFIPLLIQTYFQKWVPFSIPRVSKRYIHIKHVIYGINIFLSLILLVVSFNELEYLFYRAPDKEYEIFKLIFLLNYASTIIYIIQAQRFMVKLKRASNDFREYIITPESHNFNDTRMVYDAVKLYSFFLPFAMIYNSQTRFANYCVAANLSAGGGQYQVKWIVIDDSTYNSFEEISDLLTMYFMPEIKKAAPKLAAETTDDLFELQ